MTSKTNKQIYKIIPKKVNRRILSKHEILEKIIYVKGIWGEMEWALPIHWYKYSELPTSMVKYGKYIELQDTPRFSSAYMKPLKGIIGPLVSPFYCLVFMITRTRKNIYFSLTDITGKILLTISAGMFKIHRRKRMSPDALEPLFAKVLDSLRELKVSDLIFEIKYKARYMLVHASRFFKANNINLRLVYDRIRIPHNGCRLKKKRRL